MDAAERKWCKRQWRRKLWRQRGRQASTRVMLISIVLLLAAAFGPLSNGTKQVLDGVALVCMLVVLQLRIDP